QIQQTADLLPTQRLGGAPPPPPGVPVLKGSSLRTSSRAVLRDIAARVVKPPALQATAMDLFTDDTGRVDLGDTQVIVLTMLGICVFGVLAITAAGSVALVHGASLPDLDGGLVALLGVSQGSYLMKKFSAS